MGRRSPKPFYHGSQRVEFIGMKGPHSKGCAEMACTKDKEESARTPTDEQPYTVTEFEIGDEMEVSE